MENRLNEIRECRGELQRLAMQINDLSARIASLERAEAFSEMNGQIQQPQAVNSVPPRPQPQTPQWQHPQAVNPVPQQTPQWQQPQAVNPIPQQAPQWLQYAPAPQAAKPKQNLESRVGKNLFAVLASLLVLLGVGVFISTIYAYIPDAVKIIAIYLFGFVLLGGGLALYLKNINRFWLGVASCGLAELMVSIITSHSYFGVLSLGGTFGLMLLWIVASFWLTKFHPTVFKTIGYIGFTISILLGLSLLEEGALPMYLTLLGAFAVLSVFFVLTNAKHVKMNTALAFLNVVNFCHFLAMSEYLPQNLNWVKGTAAFAVLGVYNGIYLLRGGLHKEAYPYFSMVSMAVLAMYLSDYAMAFVVPVSMCLLLVLWFVNHRVTQNLTAQVLYSLFTGGYAVIVSFFVEPLPVYWWYAGFAVVAYGLYFFTKRRTAAWIGLVSFGVFYLSIGVDDNTVLVAILAAALGMFAVLNFTKLLRKDTALEIAWYLTSVIIACSLNEMIKYELSGAAQDPYLVHSVCDSVFSFLLTLFNTAYLHYTIADRQRIMRFTTKGIFAMVVQGILLISCLSAVESDPWFVPVLGVIGSLLIVSYSLLYTLRNKKSGQNILIWQFIKFSLYCGLVLSLLGSPGILVNITLLLVAIAAVVVGFRLEQKTVRIYGLVLSLLDVVCLVLFNVDYSDSLKLAGGIVLCGILCFVISFIYSRLSKAAAQKRE